MKNRSARQVSTLLIVTMTVGWCSASAFAQTATLQGTVTDAKTGEVLAGANVSVTSAGLKTGAITSLTGRFEVKGLSPGTYTVTVSYVGFVEKVVYDVVLRDRETKSLDVSLLPTVLLLNPVVVSASRHPERFIEAPAGMSTVEKAEIEARPTLSPTEHLKGLPAVDIVSTGLNSDRIVVRGFNNAFSGRLLTLTDHRIGNVPALRVNFPQLIPSTDEDIERMEVLEGPGSALYGPNVAGGVLHILTKSPFDSKGTKVSAGIGERRVRMASFRHAGAINERIGYKISSAYYQGKDWEFFDPAEPDSIVKGVQTSNGRIDKTGKIPNQPDFNVKKISGDVRFDYRWADDSRAILSGGFSRFNNIELTGLGRAQLIKWMHGYVQGRLIYKDLFAQAFFNWNDGGDSFDLRNGDLFIDNSTLFVTQVQHGFTLLNGRQRFTYGVDALFTRPKTRHTLHGRNEEEDDITETGYFVQSETGLCSSLKWVSAARLDDHSRLEKWVFSPRAALIFRPEANHSFRLTFNRGFDAPLPVTLFIDFLVSPTLGPLPYAIRIRGVPPETGYNFRRDTSGGVGGLYMQSPFTPGGSEGRSLYLPADATLMWPAVVAFLRTQDVDISALPPPNSKQVGTALRTLNADTQEFEATTPRDVLDIPPLEPSRTTTFEIGYKGVINKKLLLATNLYYENTVNSSGVFATVTPNVFLEPSSLAAYLTTFMPANEATDLAKAIAEIPVGTIAPQEGDPADVAVTTRSFGDVSYYGAEIEITCYTDRNWTFSGNYTHRSKNFFRRGANEPDDIALNAPKHMFGASAQYKNPKQGFSAQLRARYVGRFPVMEGIGRGTISSYSVLDFNVSYDLPFHQSLNLTLSVQNLLNNKHREYIGVPKIGRLGILRLTYSL